MGSKVIILLGLLASALYIYFFINQQSINLDSSKAVNTNSVVESSVKNIDENKTDQIANVEPTNEPTSIPEENAEEEVVVTNKRISTPAFGFMSGTKKNQIVALMSDNDENGPLAKRIEDLCKKTDCNKDMRYEDDIIDAPWQEEVGKIITLLTDGSIDDGSLFIEGNVLKLEGSINSNEIKTVLEGILDNIKSDTFKVENHSKLSNNIKADEIKREEESRIDSNQKSTEEATKREELPVEPVIKSAIEEPTIEPVVKEIEKTETAVALSSETKEIKTAVVEKTRAKTIKKTEKKTKKLNKPTRSIKSVKRASTPEILPEPVMTTTLDEEAQITGHSIKENIKATGLVAKPVMDTTLNDEVHPRESQNGQIYSKKNSEAEREIKDLLVANPIVFEARSSKITKESRDILDKIVQIVNEAENRDIIIEGYANTGSDKIYNKVLSQKRADIVKRYLKSKKIKSNIVRSVGRGEDISGVESSSGVSDGKVEIRFIAGEIR
jgi:outer membrane protein OmpA-like peptidoglycan-associated protein